MAHEHIKIRGPIPSVDTVGTLGTIATVKTNSETAPQADYNLGRDSEAIKNLDQEQLRGVYKETDVGHANEESSPMNASLAQALNKEAGRENALYAAENSNPNRRRNIVVAVVALVFVLIVIIAVAASGNNNDDANDESDSEIEDVDEEQAIVFNVGRLNGLCQSSGLQFVVCLDETTFFACDAPQRQDACPDGTTCACPLGTVNAISDDVDITENPFCREDFVCGDNLEGVDVVDDEDLSEIEDDNSSDDDFPALNLITSCEREGRVCTSSNTFASCVGGQFSEEDCAEATCQCANNVILKDLDASICSETLFC